MSKAVDYSDPMIAACAAYAKEVNGDCWGHAMAAAINAYHTTLGIKLEPLKLEEDLWLNL